MTVILSRLLLSRYTQFLMGSVSQAEGLFNAVIFLIFSVSYHLVCLLLQLLILMVALLTLSLPMTTFLFKS